MPVYGSAAREAFLPGLCEASKVAPERAVTHAWTGVVPESAIAHRRFHPGEPSTKKGQQCRQMRHKFEGSAETFPKENLSEA
jgi:hypothetical protein